MTSCGNKGSSGPSEVAGMPSWASWASICLHCSALRMTAYDSSDGKASYGPPWSVRTRPKRILSGLTDAEIRRHL